MDYYLGRPIGELKGKDIRAPLDETEPVREDMSEKGYCSKSYQGKACEERERRDRYLKHVKGELM